MTPVLTLALLSASGCLRDADAGGSSAPTSSPSPSPSPLPPPPPVVMTTAAVRQVPVTEGGARVGDSRPARVLDLAQVRAEMRKARGQALFVHLWATWCLPCLDELPLIEQFARRARARGAAVLSVSLDSDASGIARVPSVLRDRAPTLTATVARFEDPEPFIALFSPEWEGAIPALFAFDRAGKLQASLIGEVEPAELDTLLAKLAPPSSPDRRQPRR